MGREQPGFGNGRAAFQKTRMGKGLDQPVEEATNQ